mmetsp:Transcript_136880/g.222791  ORF Transcript_136880/g.222791 Transcript_136880/m.222791 type:complete len:299 (-) Transcript_136880:75-971(-)
MYYALAAVLLLLSALLVTRRRYSQPLQVSRASAAGIPHGVLGSWADNETALQQIFHAIALENRPVLIKNALATSLITGLQKQFQQLRFRTIVSGHDTLHPFGPLGAGRWKHLATNGSCSEVKDAFGGTYGFRFRQAAKNFTQAPALLRLRELFASQAWLRFTAALAGAIDRQLWWEEQGLTHFGVGDFIAPHSDDSPARLVAFVLYLGPEFNETFASGGELVWCPSGQRVHAASNTLLVFRVDPMAPSEHMVLPPQSEFERIAFTGWLASRDGSYTARWHQGGPTPPRQTDLIISVAV